MTPRIDEAAARRESAEMADRFNRLFLRTLRALRDLRRYAPTVNINNLGGQVNVANTQVVANTARLHAARCR